MRTRTLALVTVALASACSRSTDGVRPKAVPEQLADASARAATSDAGALARAPAEEPSAFAIVARAPTPYIPPGAFDIGSALPLVQRLPGGGLVVASELARAHAAGDGPLAVALEGRGLEADVMYRGSVFEGSEGVRWVWSDDATTIISDEIETGRTGPRLESYKLGPNGFALLRANVGYWSAAVRAGAVLALERTAYEIPDSSIYAKGSGYEQNGWGLKPARVAVLAGSGAPPALPPNVCATAMSAAPDGTAVITVEKCDKDDSPVGVLRYAPGATQAKLEWLEQPDRTTTEDEVHPLAVSAREIYVAHGDRLDAWNGAAWSATTPFPSAPFASISRAPSGELWVALKPDGRVMKRAAEGGAWARVPLPSAPADRLDDALYAAPMPDQPCFLAVSEPPEDQALRAPVAAPMIARRVDAAGDEVLILATVDREAFVLSTKPRAPIARVPSIPVQRARILQQMKRRVPASPKECPTSILVLPDGTPADAIRASLGDAGAGAWIGEGLVEGRTRIFVYGEPKAVLGAQKSLAARAPQRLCGPGVVDRVL